MLIHNTALTMRGKRPNWLLGVLIPTSYILGGEFTSVARVNSGIENMINQECNDKDILALIKYIAEEDKLEKILENQQVIKTPVVRNGKELPIMVYRLET